MTPNPDLLPCPFCGGRADLFGGQWHGFPFIECQACLVKVAINIGTPFNSGDVKLVASATIKAWNARAALQVIPVREEQ